jgi:hypothetical protein
MHVVNPSHTLEGKVTELTRKLKMIKAKGKSVRTPKCVGCNKVGHVVEECPIL